MTRQPEQQTLFDDDVILPCGGEIAVVHVASHVRRKHGGRAIGKSPAPLMGDVLARNRWVLEQLEAWRKAEHAATQQRSQGAKFREQAHVCEVANDVAEAAACDVDAERCYQRAEQHSQRALEIRLALTARVR